MSWWMPSHPTCLLGSAADDAAAACQPVYCCLLHAQTHRCLVLHCCCRCQCCNYLLCPDTPLLLLPLLYACLFDHTRCGCSRRMQCIYVDREKKAPAAAAAAGTAVGAGSAAANGDSSSCGRPLTPDRAAAVAAAGGDAAGAPAADVGVSGADWDGLMLLLMLIAVPPTRQRLGHGCDPAREAAGLHRLSLVGTSAGLFLAPRMSALPLACWMFAASATVQQTGRHVVLRSQLAHISSICSRSSSPSRPVAAAWEVAAECSLHSMSGDVRRRMLLHID